MVKCEMLVLAVWWMSLAKQPESCEARACTTADILALQRCVNCSMEQLEGQWTATAVYDATGQGTAAVSSYTLDVVATAQGWTLYISSLLSPPILIARKSAGSNSTVDRSCQYEAVELSATATAQASPLWSTGTETASGRSIPRTVVVAGADQDLQHILLYLCDGQESHTQSCVKARALLLGRQFDPTAARNWLKTVSTALPCFDSNDTLSIVLQDEGLSAEEGVIAETLHCTKGPRNTVSELCPLKPLWGLPGRNCTVSSFLAEKNFDLNMYVSRVWREHAWLAPAYLDPSTFYQDYVHDYRPQPNGSITCFIAGRSPVTDPANDKCFFREILMTTTDTAGKLLFHENTSGAAAVPYNVIHVDYDHYAVVFGCLEVTSAGSCRAARAWLWGRAKTLDRRYRLQANSIFQDLCINPAAMLSTQHKKECNRDSGDSGSLQSETTLYLVTILLLVATHLSSV